jgi:hypothetical protein
MKIPERKDDSAAEFSKQQDAIAQQVQAKLDERFDREVKAVLDKDGK